MSTEILNTEKSDFNTFTATDFFMLRTPIHSIDRYMEVFCQDEMSKQAEDKIYDIVLNNSEVREAILVSSLSLYNELKNIKSVKDNRKKEQVFSSLVKYLTRMTTRTTPFGLFSGVTRGGFSDYTEINISNKKNIKRARPDMEWIYAVIRSIENNKDILNDIHITKNKLNNINGSRVDISYISNYGQLQKDDNLDNLTASIRNTKQVQIAMELANSPIKYKDLLNTIKSNNPNVDINKIKEFIDKLIVNEYLITEMRPPLANIDPFLYVIEKLDGIKAGEEIYGTLLDIKKSIDKYNTLVIGEGESIYLEIIEKMKVLHECENYIQVDMNIATKNVLLSKNIAREIERIAELTLKFSLDRSSYDYMGEYLNAFLEEYGDNREIQLLELLDENKGLGAPAGYTNPMSHRKVEYFPESIETKNIQSYLLNKVLRCLLNREDEVIIYDDEIEEISSKYTDEEIPDSLELYVLLSKQENVESEDITLHLGPNYGSSNAGKSFGRFMDIMPKEIYKDFKKLEESQYKLFHGDTIIVEIVELPQSGRLSNVSLNYNLREYELVISTNGNKKQKQIDISDLYIGIENKNGKRLFYIKSKSLNKRVVVKANNMLNYSLCSNIYKFLMEVSSCGKRNILGGIYTQFSQCFNMMNYTPRIKYSKTIIYPATWKLNYGVLKLKPNKISKTDFYRSVDKWRKGWNVPNFVYLQEGDNRLLLNLSNILHLDELYSILIKSRNSNLTITEIEGKLKDRIVGKNGERFCAEIVVPIIRNVENKKIDTNKEKMNIYPTISNCKLKESQLSTFDNRRTFYPGDEWLSIKLYGNSNRVDEFIGFKIMPLCEQLLEKGYIQKFFFLRYSDPEKHIRLRLYGRKENIQKNVMSYINLYFKELLEEGLLNKAIIDTYKREVERYGGMELIELAEEVFYYDSLFVCHIINYMRINGIGVSIESIIVASIINMMEEWGIPYKTQKEIFLNSFDKNMHRSIFQAKRRELVSICNSNNNWNNLKKVKGGDFVYKLFELRKDSINNFGDKMTELDDVGELCNEKKSILFSMIHMHCNRMFGDRQKENIILSMVRHTLYALEFFKK